MKRLIKTFLMLTILVGGFFAPGHIAIQQNENNLLVSKIEVLPSVAFAQNTGVLYEKCEFLEVYCGVKNAVLHIFEIIWYYTTFVVAFLTGFAADILLFHSMSSATYRTGIVEAGWEILRNLINIVFIFSLLFVAFKMVLGSDSVKVKKTLVKTIVVALVVNFSLFMSYVIIDASNILGNIFYNRIEVEGDGPTLASGNGDENDTAVRGLQEFFSGQSGFASPSTALVSKFNPQKIVTKISGNPTFLQKWIIVFSAGGINILMIVLFVSILLLFLGRTVGLIISCILAPLAFVTLTIPSEKATNLPYVGFNSWLSQLISLAFMAPVYLFFLFLVIMFANDNALFNSIGITSDSGFFTQIIVVFISFGLIATILFLAKKITKDMAGKLGGMVASTISKAAAGIAVATGAGAALTATVGGAAVGGLARIAPKGSRVNTIGRQLQTTKFDISKIPGFKQTVGQSSIGQKVARGVNTSYSDVDTRVVRGVNNIKSRYDDIMTNRTPESVVKWGEAVQESKDKYTSRTVDNAQRVAKAKATITKTDQIKIGFDPVTNIFQYQPVGTNLKDLLEQKQREWARMDSQAKGAEKKKIEEQKSPLEADLESLRKQIRETTNKADRDTLKKQADEVKKKIEDIDNTSTEGIIKQIEKELDKVANDARAGVLNNDKQASRVGGGKIKTSPKIGKDDDK